MGLAPQNPSPPLRGAPGAPLRGGGARRARPRYTHVKDALVHVWAGALVGRRRDDDV